MTNIILSGCSGRMGQVVTALCADDPELEIVAGFDANPTKRSDYPVYADPLEYQGGADCLVDFSSPVALSGLLAFCKKTGCAAVLATTGYSEAQRAEIQAAAETLRIFQSANMSLGINVLSALVKQAAQVLGSAYDVEIVEKHHNRKVDAPSGTALLLADAAASALPYEPDYVFDRHSVRQPRGSRELGISSVRGGTIVGEHEVLFAGNDEVLTLTHTAYSRQIFAVGAMRAARFLKTIQAPGMYSMSDLVSEVLNHG